MIGSTKFQYPKSCNACLYMKGTKVENSACNTSSEAKFCEFQKSNHVCRFHNEILRFARGLVNSARYRMSFKFQESRETHVDRHYQYLHRLCTYL